MMKIRLLFLSLGFILFYSSATFGQEVWSLQRCIGYAQEQNISLKQAQASVRVALLAESSAQAARLPSLSANVNLGEQFGRTIDPTTNAFSVEGVGFNSLSLNANLPIYQGGMVNNSIKQARIDRKATEADAEQFANDLALQVAQFYLNVLMTQEQLKNAQGRLSLSQQQLSNTQKLIDAGSLPAADKFNVLAQIARDEQTLVIAQNNVDNALLALKLSMQLEPEFDLRIESPQINIAAAESDLYAMTLPAVYASAVNTQPNVRAAGFRVESAHKAVDIAKSGYYPSIGIFANLTSNYSSQYPDQDNIILKGLTLGPARIVNVAGTDVPVREYIPEYEIPTLPYFNQIEDNFGQGVGININIPIYQNGRTKLGVERARLGVISAQMQEEQTRRTLKNDVQTALANARAGKKQLDAAQRTFDAMRTAYVNTEKRHALGAVNTLELNTSKSNLDLAENDLIVARYNYLFTLKILDFYLGKPLVIN